MTYLAVPIAAEDLGSASGQIEAACAAGAEMLELRTDYLRELDTDKLASLLDCVRSLPVPVPVIVTCRDKAQGGAIDYPLEFRTRILAEAVRRGADYIDCEYDNFLVDEVRRQLTDALNERAANAPNTGAAACRLILSAHDFNGPFEDLASLYAEMISNCPDAIPDVIPKLVYTASHVNDCFAAFDLLGDIDRDAIVLCMGAAGVISRILAKKFGGFATFASLDEQASTAPGQVTVTQMKTLYRWDRLDRDTELYGVIGSPVAHSMSPAIFNASFEAEGINAVYVPVLLQGQQGRFDEFMNNVVERETAGRPGFRGFSVTIPHKAHALKYVETVGGSIEALAANIGAVNTLKVGFGGIVSGCNTDYAGAIDALVAKKAKMAKMAIDRHSLHGRKIAVIGAGGVARAVVAGLTDVAAEVTVYNRTVSKAKALAEEFGCRFASSEAIVDMDAEIVINCTSVGMYPDTERSPVPRQCLGPGMVVFDTVYNPIRTLLLSQATEAGAKTIPGTEMFIRQAMAQFAVWRNRPCPEQTMRDTVLQYLG